MNYEATPDYHNACNEIMVVRPDDFWIYTPHFKKILGLAIGELFKTKITMLGCADDTDMVHTLVFLDAQHNRFALTVLPSEVVDDQNPIMTIRICARFPLSGTKVQMSKTLTDNEISTPAFNASPFVILVHDTSAWHHDGA